MRNFCPDCTRKHLSQAEIYILESQCGPFTPIMHITQAKILMEEFELGYPNHGWLAIGHLANLENKLLNYDKKISQIIRDMRLKYIYYINGEFVETLPNILDLIESVSPIQFTNYLPEICMHLAIGHLGEADQEYRELKPEIADKIKILKFDYVLEPQSNNSKILTLIEEITKITLEDDKNGK